MVSAIGYPELGELLGMATGSGTVVTAVPGGPRPSWLSVRITEPPPPRTEPQPSPPSFTVAGGRPEGARPENGGVVRYASAALAAIVAGFGYARRKRQ